MVLVQSAQLGNAGAGFDGCKGSAAERCRFEGRTYTARSRHGAANALARQLVAAGLADRSMVIRYHGLAGTMIYHSFHTAAISMSMAWANSYASRSTADVRPVQG